MEYDSSIWEFHCKEVDEDDTTEHTITWKVLSSNNLNPSDLAETRTSNFCVELLEMNHNESY